MDFRTWTHLTENRSRSGQTTGLFISPYMKTNSKRGSLKGRLIFQPDSYNLFSCCFLFIAVKNYCRLQNRHMALMALIGQSTFCTKPSTMAQKCLQNSGNMSHEQIQGTCILHSFMMFFYKGPSIYYVI